jgi:calcineurin-like phosphoesterase family protein
MKLRMPLNPSIMSITTTSDSDNMKTAHYYKHCYRKYQQCPIPQREQLITSKLPNTTNNTTKHFKTFNYYNQWL